MNSPQLTDGHLGVYLGCLEPGVAEHLLDEADVGAVFQHVRGAGVPEEVAGTGLLHAGGIELAAHPVADVLRTEALAVAGDEEGVLGGTQ